MNVLCLDYCVVFFVFKQKTAYEMRISDWSSDVCSSDLGLSFPGSAISGRPSVGRAMGRQAMAKGQMRSNREVRKPKATKPVAAPAAPSFQSRAKPTVPASSKKKS